MNDLHLLTNDSLKIQEKVLVTFLKRLLNQKVKTLDQSIFDNLKETVYTN